MTSPLNNLEKQKTLAKNSIHNSFMGKMQMYSQAEPKIQNESMSMSKSQSAFSSLKASTLLYKLP